MGKGGEEGKRGGGEVTAAHSEILRCAQDDNETWQLWIDEQPRPGWANMAIDLTLLDRAEQQGESWLRLYQWKPHCLSFGRHEPATRRYDVARIQSLELDTVRRPTGGRAVWHGRELTYAVAAPNMRFGSLRDAYLEIHTMLADSLRQLGAAASLAPRRRAAPVEAGACFSQPAGGEVMITGRKVIGSAQLRRGSALLQHGSILLEENQSIVHRLTSGSACEEALTSPLAMLLDRPVGILEMTQVVVRAAAERWPGSWEQSPHAGLIVYAATRYFPQFQSPAWTWAR